MVVSVVFPFSRVEVVVEPGPPRNHKFHSTHGSFLFVDYIFSHIAPLLLVVARFRLDLTVDMSNEILGIKFLPSREEN